MSPAARRFIWRTVVGIAGAIAILVVALVAAFGSGYVRNFYMPAEGMAPTLEKGDRFVAFLDGGGDLKRGDIILFTVGGATYVKRVAALAGDSIAMREGIVVLNGSPAAQRLIATEQRPGFDGVKPARRLAERFAGEPAAHDILDMGPSMVDDFPETKIPAGFVFVLGDNRDMSADSRVTRAQDGVELLPVADVEGRPLFCIQGCKLAR